MDINNNVSISFINRDMNNRDMNNRDILLDNKIFVLSANKCLTKPDLIIHHKNCPDGTSSAWVAKKLGGNRCKSVPTPAGVDVNIAEILVRNCIWYVDISPSYKFLIELHNEYLKGNFRGSITIIDHHESFKSTIEKLIDANELFNMEWLSIYYDNNRSGCQLTWDYTSLYCNKIFTDKINILFTSDKLDNKLDNKLNNSDIKIKYICEKIKNNDVKLLFDNRPWFINYTGERDLWRFDTLPNCKEINTALYANCNGSYTYKYYDMLNSYKNNELIEYLKNITEQGVKIIEENDKIIKKFANMSKHMKYYETPHINISKTTQNTEIDVNICYNIWLIELDSVGYQLRSEIGNYCMSKEFLDGTKPDFVVCATYLPDVNIWRFACRGADKVNLSVFCAKFGGGGHPNAAGFELPPGNHYNTIFNY